jgi:UDP-N-acetylglucosamine--N-acetylmuramyl-(pentapeptide) pyrophosphoryl-undecaprenol N-acetylglucosamine transferase
MPHSQSPGARNHRQSLYFFAGGGTGGHLFPGLTLAMALPSRDPAAESVFIGSERELERELVARHQFCHRVLPVEPLPTARRNPLKFCWRNWRAYRIASGWLRQERPAAVIGLGGFASVPTVLAASRLGIPTVLLEQNLLPGRATQWLSRRADLICLSFSESAAYFSKAATTRLTGNPVRPEIARLTAELPSAVSGGRPTLLVLGGSQGANSLNAAVARLVERWPGSFQGWRIIHQTGAQQAPEIRARYAALGLETVVEPFFREMVPIYREATLVISRAGATTLAELACVGAPAVLVPFPQAADNHQLLNAEAYAKAGAATTVLQAADPETTAARLAEAILPLLVAESRRAEMATAMRTQAHPDATGQVLAALEEIIGRRA